MKKEPKFYSREMLEKLGKAKNSIEIEAVYEPNLVFVGRRERLNKETRTKELVQKELPRSYITPRGQIIFSDDAEWGKPFYCKEADYLKQVFRKDFKEPSFLLGSDK